MSAADRLAGFGFSDGQDLLTSVGLSAEHDDVEFVAGLVRGIGQCAGGDAGAQVAEGFGCGVPAGPVPCELFEVWAEDFGAEGGLRAFPDLLGVAGALQVLSIPGA